MIPGEKKKLNLKKKLKILDGVYDTYEQFIKDFTHACKRSCAECCTCNLTMTTLEGFYLLDNLISADRPEILKRLSTSSQKRFKPELTFNQIASLYAQGKEVPEAQSDPSWGKCPFLENLECIDYQFRPFGCRCMVSKKPCSETGFAEMDPILITVNNVFMQFIEHLDSGGYSGNFTDILNLLSDEKNRKLYENNRLKGPFDGLVSNSPICLLMVPPEHRKKTEPLLSVLNRFFTEKS